LKLKGAVQPVRLSVFEPVALAIRRQQEAIFKKPDRYGAPVSKVQQTVRKARMRLERSMGLEALPDTKARDKSVKSHAAAKAGRRAKQVRRQTKMPKVAAGGKEVSLVDTSAFDKWMATQFNTRQ